jgi:hypothetical protein
MASSAEPEPAFSPVSGLVVEAGDLGSELRDGATLDDRPLGVALGVSTFVGAGLGETSAIGLGLASDVGEPGASR